MHKLFESDDITKLSTVEQHCNYRCSVTLTVIPEITCSRIFITANRSWPRASNFNFNKTMCVLMTLAIDSIAPGCRIYKDVWSAGLHGF